MNTDNSAPGVPVSTDDTPPRVWWWPSRAVLIERSGTAFVYWRDDDWLSVDALPADAVELRPASAAVDPDRLARALHDADCGCDTYDDVEDPRYIDAVTAVLGLCCPTPHHRPRRATMTEAVPVPHPITVTLDGAYDTPVAIEHDATGDRFELTPQQARELGMDLITMVDEAS